MKTDFIIVDGEVIYHGDYITAELNCDDHWVEIEGRLCINKETAGLADSLYYICQNECDGDCGAEDKFDYEYSWSFRLDERSNIATEDTRNLKFFQRSPNVVEEDIDDDPMPPDWVCEEKIPDDL